MFNLVFQEYGAKRFSFFFYFDLWNAMAHFYRAIIYVREKLPVPRRNKIHLFGPGFYNVCVCVDYVEAL